MEDKWFKVGIGRLFDRNRLGKHAGEVLKIGKISHPTLTTTIRMLLVFWSIRRR